MLKTLQSIAQSTAENYSCISLILLALTNTQRTLQRNTQSIAENYSCISSILLALTNAQRTLQRNIVRKDLL